MKSIAALVAVLISGGVANSAPTVEPGADADWSRVLPARCVEFAPVVDLEHPRYWDRQLSLASCLQDASIERVESPFDVGELVADLSLALGPPMLIWRDALDRAPDVIQLRAAYHVGLAAVAMMTRARASLVAPADIAKADAATRERVLRARLESLLAPTKKVAWSAFTVIDNAAREVPELERDPVHRAMVRSARMILRVLEPMDGPLPQLAGTR